MSFCCLISLFWSHMNAGFTYHRPCFCFFFQWLWMRWPFSREWYIPPLLAGACRVIGITRMSGHDLWRWHVCSLWGKTFLLSLLPSKSLWFVDGPTADNFYCKLHNFCVSKCSQYWPYNNELFTNLKAKQSYGHMGYAA